MSDAIYHFFLGTSFVQFRDGAQNNSKIVAVQGGSFAIHQLRQKVRSISPVL